MTITVKKRNKKPRNVYVYYNDWTGEIISVGNSLRLDCPAPYIETQEDSAFRILKGEINEQNFVISSDRFGKEKLMRKNEFLQLRRREDSLFLLPEYRLKEWDIRAKLFVKNGKLVFEANRNKIRKLVAHSIHREIKLNVRAVFDFYLIRKDRPDYLLETFQVDAQSLINHGRAVVDVNHMLAHTRLENISILTRRHFENYYFELVEETYVDVTDPEKRERPLFWKRADNEPNAHLRFVQQNDIVTVESLVGAEQLDDVGINQLGLSFFVIKGDPDHYLGTFEIDMSRIRMGQQEKFQVDFDIDEIDLLYQNQALKVNKRKIQ